MPKQITLTAARALVREYFHVENDAEADDLLCAALRVERIPKEPFYGDGKRLALWITESVVRDSLASTRALFCRSFKVEEEK